MSLKMSKEGFEGQKWRGEIMKLCYNLKKEKKNGGKDEKKNEAEGFEV